MTFLEAGSDAYNGGDSNECQAMEENQMGVKQSTTATLVQLKHGRVRKKGRTLSPRVR